MKKLRYSYIYQVLALCCCLFVNSKVGNSQNFSKTIFNNGNTTLTLNNFPDPACADPSSINGFNVPVGCDTFCVEDVLDGAALNSIIGSSYHIMDIGDTINLSITVGISSFGNADFNSVAVYYWSNVGTNGVKVDTIIGNEAPFCANVNGNCSETYFGSIIPTSGSLNGAIVVETGVGGYLMPLSVTGPVLDVEVDTLGTIITPQIPYLVLHDPPGDASYSEFLESTRVCRTTTTTYEESIGGGFNAAVKVGVAGSIGVVLEQGFEFSAEFANQFSMTHTDTYNEVEEVCVEAISEFKTSDAPTSIGEDADVFVGYGETLKWGIYDIVTYDGCTIGTRNGMAYYSVDDEMRLFFSTARTIRQDIAAQLAIANDPSNSDIIRDRAYNQAEVWQDVLAQNAANIANASETFGPPTSFGGGSPGSFSQGLTTTQIKSISYDVAIENNSQINLVAIVGATGFTGGPEFTFTKNEGTTTDSTTTNEQFITSVLLDDEDGGSDTENIPDVFFYTPYKDPSYGTAIFRLENGSRTSCPYEGGYRRDQPRLSWESNACPGEDVKFLEIVQNIDSSWIKEIEICNDSDEENDYQLSVSGNLGTATIMAGGGTLSENTDVVNWNAIPPGTCITPKIIITPLGDPDPVSGTEDHSLSFAIAPNCNTSPGASSDVVIGEADFVQLNISFQPGATYQETAYCEDDDMDGISYLNDLCPDASDTALEFDGSDDYVEVPHNTDLNFLDQDFTMEAWVKPAATGLSKTIASKGHGSGLPEDMFIFQIKDNKIGLYLRSVAGGQWTASSSSVLPNEWSHVAVSYDSNTQTATFYLNGVQDGTGEYFTASPSPLNNSDTNPLFIGKQGYGCDCNYFDGTLDDIIFWSKALTVSEITETITTPLSGTEIGLVAYYDFNDAAACAMSGFSTLVDKGPNNQDGTLTNFTATSECVSDWTSGRNLDSDGDGIGDACSDVTCPPDYAGVNSLDGTISTSVTYETPGNIESSQVINVGSNVVYNAGTSVVLQPGFTVAAGAEFRAYIDGCNPPAAAQNTPAIIAFEDVTARPKASTIKIYPNPVAENATLAIENAWRGEMQIRVMNMLGQTTVLRSFEKVGDFMQIELDTSQFPKGHYKVLVSDGTHLATSALVKM